MKAGIPVTDACSEGETMPSLTALPELLRFAARVGSSRTRHGVEIEKNAIAATAAPTRARPTAIFSTDHSRGGDELTKSRFDKCGTRRCALRMRGGPLSP